MPTIYDTYFKSVWYDFPSCAGQNVNSALAEAHTHITDSQGNHQHTTDDPGNHYHNFIDGNGAVIGQDFYRTNTDAGAHTHILSAAGGHAHSVAASVNIAAWYPPSLDNLTYLTCQFSGCSLLFNIPLKSNTIVNALRVKYQGSGGIAGVNTKLVYRKEDNITSAWTTLIEHDFQEPGEIQLGLLEFTDIILLSNYSYAFFITSIYHLGAPRLYSVGIRAMRS